MIKSKFIEVTDRDVKNIGVNWTSLSGYQVGVSGIGRNYDSTRGNTYDTSDSAGSTNNFGTVSTRENENLSNNTSTSGSQSSASLGVSSNGGTSTATNSSNVSSNLGSTNSLTDTITDTVTTTNDVSDTFSNLRNLIGSG